MQTALTNPTTRDSMPMLSAYNYDQLNRLVESRSFEDGLTGNSWNPTSYNGKYHNAFTYDAMGNILTQQRNKRNGTQIEDLTYRYDYNSSGDLISNRLYHINDNIPANTDATDIDDMGTFDATNIKTNNNYSYNASGQLVQDRQEEIDTIIWTASGKVKKIIRTPQSSKKNLTFDYGPMGNRIAKHVYNNQTKMLESSTYYLLDAQGNQLSVYEHVVDTATAKTSYYLTERNIYGSSRLGMVKDTVNMQNPSILPSYGVLGNRKYALTNHLNNVLTVINDVVYPLSEDNTSISGYEVGISSVTDYSPFGVELDGRSFSTSKARFGFNGMEKDNEVSGSGNSYTADFWQYSPRLGKRWNIDPVVKPWESPYAAFANNPIWFVDPSGADTTGSDAGNGGLYVLGQVDIVAKKPKNMPSREVAHAAMGFFHFLEKLESLLRGSGGGSVRGGTNYYDEEGNNDQAIKGGKYTDRQPLYPLPGSIAGGAFNPEEVTKVITKEIKTYLLPRNYTSKT